ncbi:hypothetical protein TrLO_g3081 [Triparma laevis f. longispina]|uniref:Uncharacterized protein n=1 Tax=Triparma laevis f. longispina TaxID=1714387 RepID=A0A9W7CB34_9STRA|nr:hypothetical protein TrLO_g3081 [Triparma laevis f. longispina]
MFGVASDLVILLIAIIASLPTAVPLAFTGVTGRASSISNSPPKLFVFDLDNTLWTPELYQLPPDPPPNSVRLFSDVSSIISMIMSKYPDAKIGIASRTKSGDLARKLLPTFTEFQGTKKIRTLFDYVEIRTGDKTVHFKNLANESDILLSDMVFFDDALSGRYGNCVPVAKMGVTVGYCPKGMNMEIFENLMTRWFMGERGVVIHPPHEENMIRGSVLRYFKDKNYGFIDIPKVGEVFFHSSKLIGLDRSFQSGAAVDVELGLDSKSGKQCCTSVKLADEQPPTPQVKIKMPCFSMNMPFAALVANGVKCVESRNNTMFEQYEGKTVLLHVGKRNYPDGGEHVWILKERLLDVEEARTLKVGRKGKIVAICEIGKTVLVEDEKGRSTEGMERAVVARGNAMGKYLTQIKRVEYLNKAQWASGRYGVYEQEINLDNIPEGWHADIVK